MSVQPIFLLSGARTGSTLVQRVLAAHRDIATRSEPWILLPLLAARQDGLDHGRLESRGEWLVSHGTKEFVASLPAAEDDWDAQVREFALGLYEKAAGGRRFFLDKTPGNYRYVDDLARLFPEAKLVFLWRNPLAMAASIAEVLGDGRWNPHALGWSSLVDSVGTLGDAYERHRARSLAVRFEDILEGESAWRRITDYLEIEFEPEALERFAAVRLTGPLGDPGRERHATLRPELATAWRDRVDNPVRVAWCRRYLRAIGARPLNAMGYDPNELLAQLPPLRPRRLMQAAADLVTLGVDALRELAKAVLPAHRGDPSVWRELLGRGPKA